VRGGLGQKGKTEGLKQGHAKKRKELKEKGKKRKVPISPNTKGTAYGRGVKNIKQSKDGKTSNKDGKGEEQEVSEKTLPDDRRKNTERDIQPTGMNRERRGQKPPEPSLTTGNQTNNFGRENKQMRRGSYLQRETRQNGRIDSEKS